MLESYQLETSPEPGMDWPEYARIAMAEWTALLEREGCTEADVQRFLELNPSMVPVVGRTPRWNLLITQPHLPGWTAHVPDFLWIAADSLTAYPVLVEIERPSKPLFTAKGIPSAEFTQAHHQLCQWAAWFAIPANVMAFREHYGLDGSWGGPLRDGGVAPQYVLIYGRRGQSSTTRKAQPQRASICRETASFT
jgi:hypothetical protein